MGILVTAVFLSGLVFSAAAPSTQLDLAEGWRFQIDPGHIGEETGWYRPDFDDSGWASVRAGLRWEEQGFPDHDGYAWYRKTVEVPADWAGKSVWLGMRGVNDACVLYCNGTLVRRYGDFEAHSVADTPLIVDLSGVLEIGKSNVLALEVFDQGGSGGLWNAPVILTTNTRDLFPNALVTVGRAAGSVTVGVNIEGLGMPRPAITMAVDLETAEGAAIASSSEEIVPTADAGIVALTPQAGAPKADAVKVALMAGNSLYMGLSYRIPLEAQGSPTWPAPWQSLKVRNNFVTELYHDQLDADPREVEFETPRDGWVIFEYVRAPQGEGLPELTVAGENEPAVWRRDVFSGAWQSMRRLPQGKTVIRIARGEGTLEIRTLPELAYCYYPTSTHLDAFGPYDWAWLEQHALPALTTLVSHGDAPEAEFAAWRKEGRSWITNSSLPGLGAAEPPPAAEIAQAWADAPGVQTPGYDGVIVDEFVNVSSKHYEAWTEAVTALYGREAFAGKTFYAWVLDLYKQPHSLAFTRKLQELGGRYAWEKYIPEAPSEAEAWLRMRREMAAPLVEWEAQQPGYRARTMMCLGVFSAPPEMLNLNPATDYHVLLDMQMQMLANDPEFFGLGGVMAYLASYADEESLRYLLRLFHHYAVLGRTERFTQDPYILDHLTNPDFVGGLDGWTMYPAEEGSIRTTSMAGFSFLQGRYPRTTQGDQYCLFEGRPEGANRIEQEVRNLAAGRLYSAKLVAANLAALDKQQQLPLRIEVKGAELLPEYGFQEAYPSNYAHEVPPYSREHPAWFNVYRVVFRAGEASVLLAISDGGAAAPARIAFNFVEVQPFRQEEIAPPDPAV